MANCISAHIRSKSDITMKNEVLCHNICWLISAVYELDLEPVLWQEEASAWRVG
jgi:hypothetical protein